MTNHIAAIHALAGKLEITGDDYRALLVQLTGVDSCKKMTQPQRRDVREHLQGLARRYGVDAKQARARPLSAAEFEKRRRAASPQERKVWAMWHQLHRAGVVRDPSARALSAFVRRQTGSDIPRWQSDPKAMHAVIEALKDWKQREGLQ